MLQYSLQEHVVGLKTQDSQQLVSSQSSVVAIFKFSTHGLGLKVTSCDLK